MLYSVLFSVTAKLSLLMNSFKLFNSLRLQFVIGYCNYQFLVDNYLFK